MSEHPFLVTLLGGNKVTLKIQAKFELWISNQIENKITCNLPDFIPIKLQQTQKQQMV
jgi:hypothetical protein